MRDVALIGAASGWGAGYRAAEAGPKGLQEFGLAERLVAGGIPAHWAAIVEPKRRARGVDDLPVADKFDLVAAHAKAVADEVERALGRRQFPLVLGGDHTVAIGTWGAASRAQGGAPLGLIWLDAHLDAHTTETSLSMNAHGMGAAVLLGEGTPEFLAIGGRAVRPEHLCFIGIRSYEVGEWANLRRLGVRAFYMEEVAERGFAAVFADALQIASNGTAGFGLSIDLDGFDPQDVPGVGLKVRRGLPAAEVLRTLRGIGSNPLLRAMEIVEYIPELDENERTARLVLELATTILAPVPGRA
jgi:arginase